MKSARAGKKERESGRLVCFQRCANRKLSKEKTALSVVVDRETKRKKTRRMKKETDNKTANRQKPYTVVFKASTRRR